MDESLMNLLDSATEMMDEFIATLLNTYCNMAGSGCTWKVSHLNEYENVKIAKMSGEIEVGFLMMTIPDHQITLSNQTDEDLKKVASALMLADI